MVRAWAEDGSRLLCTQAGSLVMHELHGGDGFLPATELQDPHGYTGPTRRMAFSRNGSWLAFVPDGEGLVLLKDIRFWAKAVRGA